MKASHAFPIIPIVMTLTCFLLFGNLYAQQRDAEDLKLGVIKVRKPIPVEFFVEIDYIPPYQVGNMVDDLYARLMYPEAKLKAPLHLWLEVIADKSGTIVWADCPNCGKSVWVEAAKNAVKQLGKFEPQQQRGILVPVKFKIEVVFVP